MSHDGLIILFSNESGKMGETYLIEFEQKVVIVEERHILTAGLGGGHALSGRPTAMQFRKMVADDLG